MGEFLIPANEAQIYEHQIGPQPYSVEQTLLDRSNHSRLSQIERNAAASEWCLSKQKENYELAQQYILEESYKQMGERAAEHRQGQLAGLVI